MMGISLKEGSIIVAVSAAILAVMASIQQHVTQSRKIDELSDSKTKFNTYNETAQLLHFDYGIAVRDTGEINRILSQTGPVTMVSTEFGPHYGIHDVDISAHDSLALAFKATDQKSREAKYPVLSEAVVFKQGDETIAEAICREKACTFYVRDINRPK